MTVFYFKHIYIVVRLKVMGNQEKEFVLNDDDVRREKSLVVNVQVSSDKPVTSIKSLLF